MKALEFATYSGSISGAQYLTMKLVLTIISSISLFIVAIFYACIRELRRTIIGKIVLVMAICEAIDLIVNKMLFTLAADLLTHFLLNSNNLWFFTMAFETFVLLKYSKIFYNFSPNL